MANEITINASLEYEDSELSEVSMSVVDRLQTAATKKYIKAKMNVGTSEEAIPLGEVTAPGKAMFRNCDPTNFITLKVGTGGAVFAKLRPDVDQDGKGGVAFLELGAGAQAPYAVADTAACQMEYLIVNQ